MSIKEYRCGELIECTTLKASGVKFIRAEPGRQVVLVFDDTDGRASKIIREHLNGGVMVSSADMAAALAWVKDRIFSAQRVGGIKL